MPEGAVNTVMIICSRCSGMRDSGDRSPEIRLKRFGSPAPQLPYAGLKNVTARGGSVRLREKFRPWEGIGSV
jgi:hypothetical protein